MPQQRNYIRHEGRAFYELSPRDQQLLAEREEQRQEDAGAAEQRSNRAIYETIRQNSGRPDRRELASAAGKRAAAADPAEQESPPSYQIDEHWLRSAREGDPVAQEVVREKMRDGAILESLKRNRGQPDRLRLAREDADALEVKPYRDLMREVGEEPEHGSGDEEDATRRLDRLEREMELEAGSKDED